jgi:hypothetical protein
VKFAYITLTKEKNKGVRGKKRQLTVATMSLTPAERKPRKAPPPSALAAPALVLDVDPEERERQLQADVTACSRALAAHELDCAECPTCLELKAAEAAANATLEARRAELDAVLTKPAYLNNSQLRIIFEKDGRPLPQDLAIFFNLFKKSVLNPASHELDVALEAVAAAKKE